MCYSIRHWPSTFWGIRVDFEVVPVINVKAADWRGQFISRDNLHQPIAVLQRRLSRVDYCVACLDNEWWKHNKLLIITRLFINCVQYRLSLTFLFYFNIHTCGETCLRLANPIDISGYPLVIGGDFNGVRLDRPCSDRAETIREGLAVFGCWIDPPTFIGHEGFSVINVYVTNVNENRISFLGANHFLKKGQQIRAHIRTFYILIKL